MIKLFKRLLLVFTYGDEIGDVLKNMKELKDKQEFESKFYNLDLCEKHQQKVPGCHHDEHNCGYCKAQMKISELQRDLIDKGVNPTWTGVIKTMGRKKNPINPSENELAESEAYRDFVRKLISLRKKKDFFQEDIAMFIDITQSRVSRLERFEKVFNLFELRDYLNIVTDSKRQYRKLLNSFFEVE